MWQHVDRFTTTSNWSTDHEGSALGLACFLLTEVSSAVSCCNLEDPVKAWRSMIQSSASKHKTAGHSPDLNTSTIWLLWYPTLRPCCQEIFFLRSKYPNKTIQNYQRDALNIIYPSNIITLLYMFRVSSTHLQEDIVVHKQHMVPSLSIRVLVSCWYAAIGSSPYSCISTRH